MQRVRPELLRGLAVLGAFLMLVVAASVLQPYVIAEEGYTVVDIERIQGSPELFEGLNISSSAVVTAVTDNGTFYTVWTEEGGTLIFASDETPPSGGDRILFRGTSWVITNGFIAMHEYYALDYNVSLIRSVPGVVLFVVMFFAVFKIDFSRLAFVKRRD